MSEKIKRWMTSVDKRLGRIERSRSRPSKGGGVPDGPRSFPSKAALDLWTPDDGAHAWVSSEYREYVRSRGEWSTLYSDTGWVDLYLPYPVTGYAAFRRIGDVVTIQFRVTANVAAGEVLDPAISGIPPAHLPVADIAWYPIDTNRGTFFADKVPAAINTAGSNIHIRNTGPASSSAVFSGAVTYIAR